MSSPVALKGILFFFKFSLYFHFSFMLHVFNLTLLTFYFVSFFYMFSVYCIQYAECQWFVPLFYIKVVPFFHFSFTTLACKQPFYLLFVSFLSGFWGLHYLFFEFSFFFQVFSIMVSFVVYCVHIVKMSLSNKSFRIAVLLIMYFSLSELQYK